MKKIILSILLLIILIILYYLYNRNHEEISYATAFVERGDITETVLANGEVNAAEIVDVGAQVSGEIKTVHVELGDYVKKGQLLVEIDSTTQANELESTRARLDILKAQQQSSEIALKIAKQQNLRERKLHKQHASSDEALENSENTLAAAKARLEEIKAQIKQTYIALNTAEANLGYTRIVAPLEGTIVSLPAKQGQTVNASQSTPNIAKIANLGKMRIKLEISEGDIPKIKVGQIVRYTIFADPDHARETVIQSIDPAYTKMSDGDYHNTGNTGAVYYYAQLLVDNSDNRLRVGMTTQNSIIIDKAKNVLLVPNNAIEKDKSHYYVRLLKANKQSEKKQVNIGLRDNLYTEIQKGLKEGEEVITSDSSDKREEK